MMQGGKWLLQQCMLLRQLRKRSSSRKSSRFRAHKDRHLLVGKAASVVGFCACMQSLRGTGHIYASASLAEQQHHCEAGG